MTPSDFMKEKKKLISAIQKTIKQFLWESGYICNSATREHTRLWVPLDKKGEPLRKTYKLKGGYVIHEFDGFTSDGVITDSEGHGLVTLDFTCIPIEDLFRINQWASRYFKDKQPALVGISS